MTTLNSKDGFEFDELSELSELSEFIDIKNLQLSARPDVIIGKEIQMRPVIDVIKNMCPESEVKADVLYLPLKYESHLKYWFQCQLNIRDDRTALGMQVYERDKLHALVHVWPQFSEQDVPAFIIESVVRFQSGQCIVYKTDEDYRLELILNVLKAVYSYLNKTIEIEVQNNGLSNLPLIVLKSDLTVTGRTKDKPQKFIF